MTDDKLPFNLKTWLANFRDGKGPELVNSKGYPVRIVCYDRKFVRSGEGLEMPILALSQRGKYDLNEDLLELTKDGECYTPQHGYTQAIFFNTNVFPKFKVGDKLQRDGFPIHTVYEIDKRFGQYVTVADNAWRVIPIKDQHLWKLVEDEPKEETTDIAKKFPDLFKKRSCVMFEVRNNETDETKAYQVKFIPIETTKP